MTKHPFSPKGRENALQSMEREGVDVLIIGGGITGCGIARDAAFRGVKVGLVEKEDFAFGTSSRSSKLIHGGIRYLEYGDVPMVQESARERKILTKIAPHLVHPFHFIYPLYKKQDSMLKFRAGFFLFDKLARNTESEKHKVLNEQRVEESAPGIVGPLRGGVSYGEYITDDARFTLSNALSAANEGAFVANRAKVIAFIKDGDKKATGVKVLDTITNREYNISSKVIVNATGPWAENTLMTNKVLPPKELLLSKGIHLVFSADKIPVKSAIKLTAPSGKSGIAIRRWNYVYVGTTDIPHEGEINRPTADKKAIEEVLSMVQECFPNIEITSSDILSTWAGLRPLIKEPGKTARDTSRHDEIWESDEGVVTIAGGKLTTYRRMAERVMKIVLKKLNIPFKKSLLIIEKSLPGGEINGDFENFRVKKTEVLKSKGVSADARERITWLYGTFVDDLLRYGEEDEKWLEPLAENVPALKGEVRLAVEQEMANSIVDFMDRRSSLLLFSVNHSLEAVEVVANIMRELLNWDSEKKKKEIEKYIQVSKMHSASTYLLSEKSNT